MNRWEGDLLEDLGPRSSDPVLLCLSDPSLPVLLTATRSLHQHSGHLQKVIGASQAGGKPKGWQVSVPPSMAEFPEMSG